MFFQNQSISTTSNFQADQDLAPVRSFKIPKWPYRKDRLFSVLCAAILLVPLAFTINTHELFETVKLTIFLVLLGWAIAIVFWERKLELRIHAYFFILLGLFLLTAIFSTVFSLDILNSLFGYLRFTNTLIFDLGWVLFIILLFTAVDSREKYLMVAKLLIFDSFVISVVGLFQSFGIAYYEGLNAPTFPRAPSLLGNPNFSSMFVAGVLPFAIFLWSEAKQKFSRIYYLCASLIIAASVVAFNSRGAILAMFVALAVTFFCIYRFKANLQSLKYFLTICLIAGGLTYLFFNIVRPNIINEAVSLSDLNTTSRIFAWGQAVDIIKKYPVFGVGLDNFYAPFLQQRTSSLAGQNGNFDDPHNLFLHLAATGGIPYTLMFFGLILIATAEGVLMVNKTRDWLYIATLSGLVSVLVSSLFNPVTIGPWLLLAVLLVGLLYAQAKPKLIPRLKKYWVIGLFTGAIFIGGALVFMAAELMFSYGMSDYLTNNFQMANKLVKLSTTLNPLSQDYLIFKSYAELFSGQPSTQVVATVDYLEKLHPYNSDVHRRAGNLYYLLYQHDGQRQYLSRAIVEKQLAGDFDPQANLNYVYLSKFYMDGKISRTQAGNYLKRALVMESGEYHYWLLLAKWYQEAGQKNPAVFALSQAFKLSPDTPQVKNAWYRAKTETDIKKVPIEIQVNFAGID